MRTRTLRLQMKRGLAIMKETTDIPLKENVLLHTNEYEFFCNPTTFDRLVRFRSLEDKEEANSKLEEFFTKTAKPVTIVSQCFNFSEAISEVKTDLLIGTDRKKNFHDEWELESDEQIKRALNSNKIGRLTQGQAELQLYTDPNNMYKAMVDLDKESIEFLQFEEAMSALKTKNVIGEHINIQRRPMYIIDKLLSLVMFIRDVTENREWGQ